MSTLPTLPPGVAATESILGCIVLSAIDGTLDYHEQQAVLMPAVLALTRAGYRVTAGDRAGWACYEVRGVGR